MTKPAKKHLVMRGSTPGKSTSIAITELLRHAAAQRRRRTKKKKAKLATPRYARLLKLAKFLDTLPPEKFEFNTLVSKFTTRRGGDIVCGTVCCAIGWCPLVFPSLAQWTRGPYGAPAVALRDNPILRSYSWDHFVCIGARLFNMSATDSGKMFSPYERLPWVAGECVLGSFHENYRSRRDPNPENVAKSIRAYVKWKKTGTKTPIAGFAIRYGHQ